MNANIYVVTRAPLGAGNMAMTAVYMQDDGEEDPDYPPLPKVKSTATLIEEAKEKGATEQEVATLINLTMAMRAPVFAVGEILFLDNEGREVVYPGRKPSKWDVDVQHVGHTSDHLALGQAIALSNRLTDELRSAGFDPEVLDAIKSIKEGA